MMKLFMTYLKKHVKNHRKCFVENYDYQINFHTFDLSVIILDIAHFSLCLRIKNDPIIFSSLLINQIARQTILQVITMQEKK